MVSSYSGRSLRGSAIGRGLCLRGLPREPSGNGVWLGARRNPTRPKPRVRKSALSDPWLPGLTRTFEGERLSVFLGKSLPGDRTSRLRGVPPNLRGASASRLGLRTFEAKRLRGGGFESLRGRRLPRLPASAVSWGTGFGSSRRSASPFQGLHGVVGGSNSRYGHGPSRRRGFKAFRKPSKNQPSKPSGTLQGGPAFEWDRPSRGWVSGAWLRAVERFPPSRGIKETSFGALTLTGRASNPELRGFESEGFPPFKGRNGHPPAPPQPQGEGAENVGARVNREPWRWRARFDDEFRPLKRPRFGEAFRVRKASRPVFEGRLRGDHSSRAETFAGIDFETFPSSKRRASRLPQTFRGTGLRGLPRTFGEWASGRRTFGLRGDGRCEDMT